jgi:hypothetical protein
LVGSVLTTPVQRGLLGEFLVALQTEWTAFFQEFDREAQEASSEVRLSVQQTWDNEFHSAVAPIFGQVGMAGGTALLSGAIGAEGRIYTGTPQEWQDNVLVVSPPPPGGDPREVIFSVFREISFPIARRAMDAARPSGLNRDEEESLAARAAVRAGALILELVRPEELESYQRFFLSRARRAPRAGETLEGAFRSAYALDESLLAVLRQEIRSLATDGGVG